MANEKRLDLIDRKALAARYVELDYNTAGTPWTLRDVLNFLELAPTVDAVEVVRCKDCKFGSRMTALRHNEVCCEFHDFTLWQGDGFCSYGERREGE